MVSVDGRCQKSTFWFSLVAENDFDAIENNTSEHVLCLLNKDTQSPKINDWISLQSSNSSIHRFLPLSVFRLLCRTKLNFRTLYSSFAENHPKVSRHWSHYYGRCHLTKAFLSLSPFRLFSISFVSLQTNKFSVSVFVLCLLQIRISSYGDDVWYKITTIVFC